MFQIAWIENKWIEMLVTAKVNLSLRDYFKFRKHVKTAEYS